MVLRQRRRLDDHRHAKRRIETLFLTARGELRALNLALSSSFSFCSSFTETVLLARALPLVLYALQRTRRSVSLVSTISFYGRERTVRGVCY